MRRLRELLEAKRLERRNWRCLMTLEFFYKLLVAMLFIPLLSGCFALTMKVTGYAYITRENLRAFALHPFTLAMVLALLLLAAMFSMIDVSAVIYVMEQSRRGARAHLSRMLRFSASNALGVWRRDRFPLLLLVAALIPFMCIGLGFGAANALSIPEFITAFIRRKRWLVAGLIALLLGSYLLLTRWIYAVHCYTLEGCDFRQARRRSAALSRGRWLRDFAALLLAQAGLGLGTLALVFLLALLATGVGRLLTLALHMQWLTSVAVWESVLVSLVISFALSSPVVIGCVSAMYYRRRMETGGEPLPDAALDGAEEPAGERRLKRVYACAALLIVAGSVYMGYLVNAGAFNPPIEYLRTMEITAHRGASAYYPENTMAAFRGAWELGADWVELDVQQTRDGQIVVAHDTNLKRTTGLNKRTWELDYEQVAKLDAGSRFSREFAGERIPLLSEVAEFARDTGLRLNIELKPSGHETDFEQGVLDVIREYGIQEQCVITSQVYRVLKNVKALDEEITTVYVTSLAYGDINRLTAADHFSVEATSATYRMVSRVHNAGKQIYAWTVNTQSSINRMIEHNVDNIITDDVELARQCVAESKYSDLLSELVKTLESEEEAGEETGEEEGEE